MFTLKIINYDQEQYSAPDAHLNEIDVASVYLRERECASVWLPNSSVYKDYVNEEVERFKKDESLTDEQKSTLIELTLNFKAVITSVLPGGNDDNEAYFLAHNEEVYITDSSGKTVHVVK